MLILEAAIVLLSIIDVTILVVMGVEWRDNRLQTSGFRLQASGFRLQTSGFRHRASDTRLQVRQ